MAPEQNHLEKLHEMCTQELEELQHNIGGFIDSSNGVLKVIAGHWQEVVHSNAVALMAYDSFLMCLTNIMDLSRKFQIHLEINNLDKNSDRHLLKALEASPAIEEQPSAIGNNHVKVEDVKVVDVKVEHDKVEKAKLVDVKVEKEKVKEEVAVAVAVEKEEKDVPPVPMPKVNYTAQSIPPMEACEAELAAEESKQPCGVLFNFPRKDVSVYTAGRILNGFVTYIKDVKELRFFTCDCDSDEIQNIFQLCNMHKLRQYTGLPAEKDIFGIVLDNNIWRAVRGNAAEFNGSGGGDGSDPDVPGSNGKCTYPALLLDFGEIIEISAKDVMYYLPLEYQQIPAQAIMCQLDGLEGDEDADAEKWQKQLQDINFSRSTFVIVERRGNVLLLKLCKETNDGGSLEKGECNGRTVEVDVPSNGGVGGLSHAKDGKAPELTPEELEMLYEEPMCTSNPMKAVMGYDPQDDKRLCRFYDPKIRGCFKGASCRQEHTLAQPNGWTKDVLPAATVIDMPAVACDEGTVINITPTYILKLDRFYAHINDVKAPVEPNIWMPEDIPNWQFLQKPPLVYDMVLAKYTDGLWYRAKVIDVDDANKIFKIFYVDYGNQQLVKLTDLARCGYEEARRPLQAVLFRIVDLLDVAETPEIRKQGLNLLCELILNQSFDVRVVSSYDDLMVQFMGDKYKVPRTLINMGIVKYHKTVHA